jgi:hypothetical protein
LEFLQQDKRYEGISENRWWHTGYPGFAARQAKQWCNGSGGDDGLSLGNRDEVENRLWFSAE